MTPKNGYSLQEPTGITRISVAGFKSIAKEQSIEIQPLTILAGANSSGKSSIMQPLLLLKQTLESSYDPGTLLLNGPNVRNSSVEQIFSIIGKNKFSPDFQIEVATAEYDLLGIKFSREVKRKLAITEMTLSSDGSEKVAIYPEMTSKKIKMVVQELNPKILELLYSEDELQVRQERCFLQIVSKETPVTVCVSPGAWIKSHILGLIHVPGLRGNMETTYKVSAVGEVFPGTFENYVASVISSWQSNSRQISLIGQNLEMLGLTWKIIAEPINDTQVELKVGRLPKKGNGSADDVVNISQVGFGVSHILPVLVALLVAESGQLVYLEQPEIHLHPRAQTAMAQILADAAMRGVRVVAETHSSLLLLGIQTLVAEGKLPPELVKLHWFTRDKDGATTIRSADLDEAGAFGDWPEDFADVELAAESRYLDAAEARQRVH
ncbi:MAG: DUF3696 domain-containing protein [Acidobacteriota bacterium]|nr:DUF3696 domain-containing protein [Acidobacteriota bacterium]